jgi:nucleoside-diphosphate-sugar epimerase
MITINSLAEMIADIAGKTVRLRHLSGPLGVRGRNSHNALIRERLGWAPERPLRKGLERTYPWIAAQVSQALAITG